MTQATVVTGSVARMLVLLALFTGSASAQSRPALTVRLYNASDMSAHDVRRAGEVAAPILRDAGIDVAFRACGSLRPADRPDVCAEPLGAGEVVVRVIPAPWQRTIVGDTAFGVAYVVKASNRGWLATVYANRVAAAAARVALDRSTLLGRVMAHEVGHLLLGTDYHSPAGLMRAHWTDALLSQGPAEWRFSGLEPEAMQRALAGSAPWEAYATR